MEEKYWVQRRGSDAHSDSGKYKAVSVTSSVFGDFEEEKLQHKQLAGEVHFPGKLSESSISTIEKTSFRTLS